LPTGVQIIGPAWSDATVAAVADRVHRISGGLRGITESRPAAEPWAPPVRVTSVDLAVVGAHLHGQPLHHQLTELGARWVADTTTVAGYRLYALAGTVPPKPGLVRADGGGRIAVEVYRLGVEAFGRFVAAVPAPLCIGPVQLETGAVAGFLCEPAALDGATEITEFGGWRAYLAARS